MQSFIIVAQSFCSVFWRVTSDVRLTPSTSFVLRKCLYHSQLLRAENASPNNTRVDRTSIVRSNEPRENAAFVSRENRFKTGLVTDLPQLAKFVWRDRTLDERWFRVWQSDQCQVDCDRYVKAQKALAASTNSRRMTWSKYNYWQSFKDLQKTKRPNMKHATTLRPRAGFSLPRGTDRIVLSTFQSMTSKTQQIVRRDRLNTHVVQFTMQLAIDVRDFLNDVSSTVLKCFENQRTWHFIQQSRLRSCIENLLFNGWAADVKILTFLIRRQHFGAYGMQTVDDLTRFFIEHIQFFSK